MSTAKYFAYNNNLKVNISYKLGERIHGVNNWNELPSDFERKQYEDENYKIGNGESRKEVTIRMFNIINELLQKYKGKRILVASHLTALAFLLSNWCEVNYEGTYKYKDKVILKDKWDYCAGFKLIFDENNKLLDIKKVKLLLKS